MISTTNFQFFQSLLTKLFSDFTNGALLDNEGNPIHIKYLHLGDISTLPLAVRTSDQYLQLKDGDMALVNDPNSGSIDIFSMTLVLAIEINLKNKKKTKLFITTRVPLKPKIKFTTNNDSLIIPPSPLAQNWILNDELITAISQHPHCPQDFISRLRPEIEHLTKQAKTFKTLFSILPFDFNKKFLTQYFDKTKELILDELVNQFQYTEVSHTFNIDPDIQVKLKLEHNKNGLNFNFTGTKASADFGIPDIMTLGACKGALLSFLNPNLPINAGLLSCSEITVPKKSFVNDSTKSSYWAQAEGTSQIANLVTQSLWALKENKKPQDFPIHGVSQCSLQLNFGGSKVHFYDSLEGGTAASPYANGANALNIWKKDHLKPSIEQIESKFPIRIKNVSLRTKSFGAGKFSGGLGSTKVYELLEPADLKWINTQINYHPQGGSGGKHAVGSDITILSKDNKKTSLKAYGEMKLQKGDIIMAHSPGGGGYGEQVLDDEE